jgi:c-di-GMP-related signal transduction protein
MNRFLARQPILATNQTVFAYEILSRYGPENYFRATEGSTADVKAMDELFLIGLKQMTHGLPAFLNCTREFLLNNYLELLPRQHVVGEILESIEPDAEVLAACNHIKKQGYRLALDDYEDRPELSPFLEFADFVKIDFLTTSLPESRTCDSQKQPPTAWVIRCCLTPSTSRMSGSRILPTRSTNTSMAEITP